MRGCLAVAVMVLVTSCGGGKGEKDPLKNIIPAEDASWVQHGCQPELGKRKIQGLCAVVLLAKELKPASPKEMLKTAVQQGSKQLVDKTAEMLKDIIEQCTHKCGNLPKLPRPQDVPRRIVATSIKGVKATDLSVARDGDAYVMLVLEGSEILGAVNKDPELDKEAKNAIIDRVRDALKKQK